MPRREKSTTQKTDGWNTKMNRVYIISIRVLRSRCGRDTKHSDSVVPNCDSCWRLVQFSTSRPLHIFCVSVLSFYFISFFFVVNSSLIDASVDEYLSPLPSLPQKAVVWKDDCLPSPRTTYPSNIALFFFWKGFFLGLRMPQLLGFLVDLELKKPTIWNRSAENKWK
jgi:hypothetical protein